jgi:hypothetical protein
MSTVVSAPDEVKSIDDLDIAVWINKRYGFAPHPYWISHCKEIFMPGTEETARLPRHQCPLDKRSAIRDAFAHFGMLPE